METARYIFYGIITGIANIIPGVSGGTMALVLGFYQRLITAIGNISLHTIFVIWGALTGGTAGRTAFSEEMRRIDAWFLTSITLGALGSIVALANIMTWLLTRWHDPTYGFFFGLVLISAIVPFRMIRKKTLLALLATLIAAGAIIAVSTSLSDEDLIRRAEIKLELRISGADSSGTEFKGTQMLSMAIMGAVAISAMILPGISGSFLLLVMGGYFDILRAVAERDMLLVGSFSFGCLAGITLFTRLLRLLLDRFHDATLSSLMGLVAGSLWLIWPFRHTWPVGDETVYLGNRLPDSLGINEFATILAFIFGCVIVWLMLRMERLPEKHHGTTT